MPSFGRDWARRHLRTERKYARKGAEDDAVVKQIQDEAKKQGVTLANDGKGGLDPKLALKIFQKGKWTCAVPGCKTPKKDLDLDHISGHPKELEEDPEATAWLKAQAKKPKSNDEKGLHVLCLRHHDAVHNRERAIENGNKPPEFSK